MPPKQKQSPKKVSDDDFERCKWRSCGCVGFSSFEELAEHVNVEHVAPMLTQEVVYCLWEDCRMYDRPCYSHDWLQRHVRTHTREKPHKCIINGCRASFFTTEALSKHVETHFITKKGSLINHTPSSKKLKMSCESKKAKIKPKIATASATAVDPLRRLLFASKVAPHFLSLFSQNNLNMWCSPFKNHSCPLVKPNLFFLVFDLCFVRCCV